MTDNDAVAGVRLVSLFPEMLLYCLKDDEQGGDNEEQAKYHFGGEINE